MIILLLVIIIFLIYNILLYNKKIVKENFTSNYINSIVDRIYVINMDKDKNRMKKLNTKMNKLGLEYKRISGVNGKKIYHKYKNRTKLRPGQLGCLLSHINVIKDAVKNNYNNILVLEDDIVFHKNFHDEFAKKYNKLIKKEKNFDLIYLGCSQSLEGDGMWKYTKMKDEYYDNNLTDGTYAMLINKNIFNNILNAEKDLSLPIDTYISMKILNSDNFKTFSLFPHIITSNVNEESNTDNLKRNLDQYLKVNKLRHDDYDFN